MQPDVDGQAVSLRQLLLTLPVHFYGAHVPAAFIVDTSRTTTEHRLAADLDLVGVPVPAGAGNTVELVLVQAEDLDALAERS